MVDSLTSARAAGLRYVSDRDPGLRRRRSGKGFTYLLPAGRALRDPAERRRIEKLAIPPAWTDVWICPLPNGHLQATGRDARGRKQYRYHPGWREVRDETKFGRLIAFAVALPDLRRRIEEDLARPGLPREKVLAAVVRLLETTLLRVGNEEYARANQSFGLTTLRNRHAEVEGRTVRFAFRGKSGKEVKVDIRDRRLAAVVKRCRELPGQELFQYVDDDGARQAVGSSDVNAYLREVT
ncbi:MAG: DNA topoisomerase IB, partial [Thermoanaerobaculia bacterium]